VKIAGYAGYFAEQVNHKYHTQLGPTITLRFARERFPSPLYVGLYILTGPSLQKEFEREPMYIALAGFEVTTSGHKSVFLHGTGFVA
jgi:hypothetical protein